MRCISSSHASQWYIVSVVSEPGPAIYISKKTCLNVRLKFKIDAEEIFECFFNHADGINLTDRRDEHGLKPRTQWFIAPTHNARLLKVVFKKTELRYEVITAFEPSVIEKAIYRKYQ